MLKTQMNNKLRSKAFPFRAADRQAVLQYYADHPIPDHVQALPNAMTTFIEVNGEPLWTSTKEVGECEAITIKELIAPERHVGESSTLLDQIETDRDRSIPSLPSHDSMSSA
jgi:hypothetical protein